MDKFSQNNQTGVKWQTVALPIQQGVDARANERARSQVKLARLENGRFSEQNAITQRAGHEAIQVRGRNAEFPVPLANPGVWLYGIGRYDELLPEIWLNGELACQLKGILTRDNELVAWTGDRFYSYDPDSRRFVGGSKYWNYGGSSSNYGIPAYCPTADVVTFNYRTDTPTWTDLDGAQGETYQVMAYTVSDSIYVDIRHAETGALVARELLVFRARFVSGEFPSGLNAETLSVVWLQGRFIILFHTNTDELWSVSCPEGDVTTWLPEELLLTGVSDDWDVHRVNDGQAVIAHRTSAGGKVNLTVIDNFLVTTLLADTTLVASGATGGVAVCQSPRGFLGVAWATASGVTAGIWTTQGAVVQAATLLGSVASVQHVTIAGFQTLNQFAVGWDEVDDDTVNRQVCIRHLGTSGAASSLTKRHCAYMSSRAFTVGDEPCFLVRSQPAQPLIETTTITPVQDTFLILTARRATALNVVAAWNRGTAYGEGSHLQSVTFLPEESYKLFTVSNSRTQVDNVVYNYIIEPKAVNLDFLPTLRSAQLGRCTYTSGALVGQYDGESFVEAGFVNYPWVTSATPSVSGLGLTPLGEYYYRVYAVGHNIHGELTRSAALTSKKVTMGAADTVVTLVFTSIPFTNRDNVTFEVYRTLDGGTTFYRTSRLPNNAPVNTLSASTVTFVDVTTDDDLLMSEQDPYQAGVGALVERSNFPPPGCTTIAAGIDRLWFAGGEVARGRAACSKLLQTTQTVSWDPLTGDIEIDRAADPVTAIVATDDAVLIFRPKRVLLLTGPGPSNLGLGSFDPPRVLSSDVGALYQEGVNRIPLGVTFVSESGPRLVPQGYAQIVDISQEIQGSIGEVSGSCVVPTDCQVRFYCKEGPSAAWDYAVGQWSFFTGVEAEAAVQWNGRAALARSNGFLWLEDDAIQNDGGRPIPFLFKTAELRASDILQESHRFRRVGLTGQWRGPHVLCCRVFYDGSKDWSEEWLWQAADDLTVTPIRGETLATIFPGPTTVKSHDGVYRISRRLTRQRASSVAFEISARDNTGDSFCITELALEMGTKAGLGKMPQRTTTQNYGGSNH